MKNLKLIFIVVAIAIVVIEITSCGTKEVEKVVTKTNITESPEVKLEFSNPAIMMGSNFGNLFISMVRTQNIDMALKFTSKGSIEKFGVEKIKEKYENFKFNYPLNLKSSKNINDTITLRFATSENATGKLKTMLVTIENDSCKLILPDNLDDFLR